ncbi:copper transporter [Corynebacterium doosanense]|uniref:Copper transporter n=1 Tax=Corynebacterium doosanense CAU 212 = DSM 45436 TaxID=558173 RepID=A0A097IFZ7_9CORY|nr:copper transporter [Corynebacterium doosanense]AIT61027.1 hypothetical protein CDOO_07015 [Corynebacterium doosanense CAU 212 = DSM 45436]
MRRNSSGRGAIFTAGLGFGVAAGVALGALVIAPSIPGADTSAGQSAQAAEDPATAPEPTTSSAQPTEEDSAELVAGALADRPVLIFRTADADEAAQEELQHLLAGSGAIDAGTITLNDKYFASDAEGVTKVSELLATALLLNPETGEPEAPTEDRARALQTLRDTGFIDYEDGTILPTQGVVLLTGKAGEENTVANQARFLDAVDRAGGATVAAGPIESAEDGALIATLRAEGARTSTVDSFGEPWAAASVVLAVAQRIGGESGNYGAAESADARTPEPQS